MKRILLIFTIFILSIMVVSAEEVLDATLYTSEEEVTEIVPISTDITDKFDYKIEDNFTIEKEVNGSGVYIGQDIKLNKNVKGVGLFISKKLDLNGDLDYGLLISQNINVNSNVANDLFVATDVFHLFKDSTVNRDLFMFANRATIEGKIVRDLYVGATTVIIKSGTVIGGDVRIGANNITIEEDVSIVGMLKYNDNATVNIKDKDRFNIEIYKGDFIGNEEQKTNKLLIFVYRSISLFLLFAIVLFVFPKLLPNIRKLYKNPIDYLKNMGIGLGLVVLVPIISLLLLVLPFTTAIVFITFAFYFIIMYFSYVIVGYLIGQLLKEKFIKKDMNPYFVGLFGILLISLLCLIPLMNMFVILLGFGSVFKLIHNRNK